MMAFISFLKKEILESFRSGKLIILGILFICFGIMNPAIAKLTPWMLEIMSEELSNSGMTVTEVTVDALTSWTQFFNNIPMALIAVVIIYSTSFSREYTSGTLTLIVTKGLARYKILLAKALVMLSVWTVGYYLCFVVTYAYNAYFWDNSVAAGLGTAAVYWWLFGIWVLSASVLFSVLFSSSSAVLVGTGGVTVVGYLISLIPRVGRYSPAVLMGAVAVPVGVEPDGSLLKGAIVATALSVVFIIASVPIINKKQL